MNIKLCPELQPVYDYEVAQGNTVARIEEPAGTQCPYAVAFTEPLKICGTPRIGELAPVVEYWECRDPHYSIEAGFYCTEHQHSVAGPIPE